MGGWKGDEEGEARNMGPWYTHRAPVSQQIGKVNTKKVQCGVCEMYFLPYNLTGIACWKSVLMKRAEWGLKEADEKLKKWAPTRLYNSVKLCSFCAQLVVPEAEIDMAVTMPTKPPAALLTASKQTDMSKEI